MGAGDPDLVSKRFSNHCSTSCSIQKTVNLGAASSESYSGNAGFYAEIIKKILHRILYRLPFPCESYTGELEKQDARIGREAGVER